jgi:hypothetical protein
VVPRDSGGCAGASMLVAPLRGRPLRVPAPLTARLCPNVRLPVGSGCRVVALDAAWWRRGRVAEG